MKGLLTMVSLQRLLRGSFAWIVASSLFMCCGVVQATLIDTIDNVSIAATDPTQLGRLSRNGIPQDWSGGEPFPGVINPTISYHYTTIDLDLEALETGFVFGGYIQISFDSLATTTFLSAYLDTYAPDPSDPLNLGLDVNWLGDAGTSGNFFGTGPLFFQVTIPSPQHLILVLNESIPGGGLGPRANQILVEAFADTEFTDLTVPEPGTLELLACGMILLVARRLRRGTAA
jgi:hypothetical protein